MIEEISSAKMDQLCHQLREGLTGAVGRNRAEGILLSGGLDTSIVATLAAEHGRMKAFTVALEGAEAPDVKFATLMAGRLGFDHTVHKFGEEELGVALGEVVRVMRSFDPMEVRNSVTIQVGLKLAWELGVRSVMTGDGGDELFAGYSFFFGLGEEKLKQELEKMWRGMTFSSIDLGRALGVEVKTPLLDPSFKALAVSVEPSLKVRWDRGGWWGKWILRKAFEGLLPEEVVWRVKTPIEAGSGSSALRERFASVISDEAFEGKRKGYLEGDGVVIRDKEHLAYYEVYRGIFGPPTPTDPSGRLCPQCHSNLKPLSNFCRTCGAYPV